MTAAKPAGADTTRLVVVWLLYMMMLTLFPFDFLTPSAPLEHGRGEFWAKRYDVALNVLLFVPLGALVVRSAPRRRSTRALVIVAGMTGLLLSAAVEGVQLLLPRDSSLVDVASNTGGAILGAFAYAGLGTSIEARVARLRSSPRRLVATVIGFTLLALTTSGILQLQSRLSGWSPDYPLVLGNEVGGQRPWRGRVFELELTDRATPSRDVQAFAAGFSSYARGTRLAAYNFMGRPPYYDEAGNLPSLQSTEDQEASGSPGSARLSAVAWLSTGRPAREIARRLQQSNAFSLRIVCAADDPNQQGPARIVSNSLGPGLRNFTLGQEGRNMVFRFRAPHNGLNGSRPEFVVSDVFGDNQRREILVTYDGATLLAAVRHSDRVYRADLTPGSSLALMMTSLNIRAHELRRLTMIYLAVLFLPLGVLLNLFRLTRRDRLMWGLACVAAVAILLDATVMLVSGRPFDVVGVMLTVLVGAAVVLVMTMAWRESIGASASASCANTFRSGRRGCSALKESGI